MRARRASRVRLSMDCWHAWSLRVLAAGWLVVMQGAWQQACQPLSHAAASAGKRARACLDSPAPCVPPQARTSGNAWLTPWPAWRSCSPWGPPWTPRKLRPRCGAGVGRSAGLLGLAGARAWRQCDCLATAAPPSRRACKPVWLPRCALCLLCACCRRPSSSRASCASTNRLGWTGWSRCTTSASTVGGHRGWRSAGGQGRTGSVRGQAELAACGWMPVRLRQGLHPRSHSCGTTAAPCRHPGGRDGPGQDDPDNRAAGAPGLRAVRRCFFRLAALLPSVRARVLLRSACCVPCACRGGGLWAHV